LAASCVFATGCKKKPTRLTPLPSSAYQQVPNPDLTQAPPITTPENPISSTIATTGGGIPSNPAGSHNGWTEDRDTFKADIVYFDFDKSAIKASEQSKLETVGDYLKSNAAAAVRVEGNCDERGTEEYNRALGERRSLAAREYLVHLGIDASRVDTLSKGEDNPADPAHNEAAWKKNRRDEFVVLTAPK
jgi:peptidoglycan-associated lipoprotein